MFECSERQHTKNIDWDGRGSTFPRDTTPPVYMILYGCNDNYPPTQHFTTFNVSTCITCGKLIVTLSYSSSLSNFFQSSAYISLTNLVRNTIFMEYSIDYK